MNLILAVLSSLPILFAQTTTTIQPIDLADDHATPATGPNYSLLLWDVKSLKVPGANSHVIVRQLSNRVRFELEGAGLPRGKYSLALGSCDGGRSLTVSKYKKGWKEVHSFQVDSYHVATEQSLQKATLRGPDSLEGKGLAFFRIQGSKYTRVDCKEIK